MTCIRHTPTGMTLNGKPIEQQQNLLFSQRQLPIVIAERDAAIKKLAECESNLRFALGLHNTGDIEGEVVDRFDKLEQCRQIERERYNTEIARLTKENENYRRCYMEQFYNDLEVEKCWAVIGNWNRKHLELHEALTEYIRNREWNYTYKK